MITLMPMHEGYIAAVKWVIMLCAFQLQLIPSNSLEEVMSMLEKTNEFDDIVNFEKNYTDNGGAFFVLLDDDTVVGAGGFRRLDDETCELRRMFFLKEYRGRGLGKKMMETLLEKMKPFGYKKVQLEVFNPKTQQDAINFYKKYGFYKIPHYRSTAAQLSMEKII